MTPPSGLEDTPPRGFPYINCPHCGLPLPRFAFPVEKVAAQFSLPLEAHAAEFDAPAADGRLAPTEIILPPDSPREKS